MSFKSRASATASRASFAVLPSFVAPTVQVSWDTLLRSSADSKSLTYVDNRGGFENIWAQPIDGSAAKQVTDFRDRDIFSFDWSRDGNLVTSKGMITSDVVLVSDAVQLTHSTP